MSLAANLTVSYLSLGCTFLPGKWGTIVTSQFPKKLPEILPSQDWSGLTAGKHAMNDGSHLLK